MNSTNVNSIEKKSNKQIAIATFFNIVLIVVDVLSGVIFIPWFIRSLGTSDYAIYSLSISVINIFIIDFGLGSAVNRYVAKYRSQGDRVGLENFLATVYKLYLILTAIITSAIVVFFFFIEYMYKGLTASEIENLKIAYLITGFFSVVIFPCQPFNGILNAYERFAFLKIGNVIQKVLYILIAIVLIKLKLGLTFVVFWHSLSGFIFSIAKLLCVRFGLKIKFKIKNKIDRVLLKDILGFTIWVTIISIADRLSVSFSSSILGMVSNSTHVAIYSIAVTLESYAYLIGSTIGGFFISKISRINQETDPDLRKDKMTRLFIIVARINAVLITLIFTGFLVCGKRFMTIWLKDSFQIDSYYCAILMISPQLIYTPTQVIYSAMVVEKKLKPLAFSTIICAILHIGLAFLLGKRFGAIGVAIAFAVSQISKQILFCVFYVRSISFHSKQFFISTYLRIGIVSIITICLGYGSNLLIPEQGFSNLVRMIIVVLSIYALLLLLFGLNSREKDALVRHLRGSNK